MPSFYTTQSAKTNQKKEHMISKANDGMILEYLRQRNEILNRYNRDHPNMLIINQQNKGLSGARNAGLKAASGEYVYFCDSDDYLQNDCLEVLYNSLICSIVRLFSSLQQVLVFLLSSIHLLKASSCSVIRNKLMLSGCLFCALVGRFAV